MCHGQKITHNLSGTTLFFSTKLNGGQNIIFTVGITQINIREKKQTAYLNFEGNLNTFSTFTLVDAFNKQLLNEWQVELSHQIKRLIAT